MYISCTLHGIEAAVSGLTAKQLDGLCGDVEHATKAIVCTSKLPKLVVLIAENDITDVWLTAFLRTFNHAVQEYLRKNTDQRPEWLKTPEAAQPLTPATSAERDEATEIDKEYSEAIQLEFHDLVKLVGDSGTEGIYDCSN